MRMAFRLHALHNDHQIQNQRECDFVFHFQHALLLGLKEKEKLNEMQYRQAEATLLEQRRENIRKRAEVPSDD